MTLTYSNILPLETITIPEFHLVDTISANIFSSDELKGDVGTVVIFLANHCPYVKHVVHEVAKLREDYWRKGISFIAISSSDAKQYPEDSPDSMHTFGRKYLTYSYEYLYDSNQEVAKAMHVQCTPDFYIFDSGLHCVYHGRLDDSTPDNNIPVTGKDVRAALDALLAGQPIDPNQHPSMGCNIKWR